MNESSSVSPAVAPLLQAAAAREAAILAPYALASQQSAGRRHSEPPHPYRGPFQRDRDRIVHSAAYRRLSGKTQVFTGDLGDHHRTRLTHTLEVASIARTLARALRLNEDLVEALALVHDLGHPPFGHSGEDALDKCLAAEGGFSHNRHALRIVEELEHRYPDFPGLNLSLEVLDGQSFRGHKSAVDQSPLLEVQVVEAADSVAYDTHDADDALRLDLLTLDELLETPLWQEAACRVRRRWTALAGKPFERAILHELIDWQVGDLLTGTAERLARLGINSPAAARQADVLVRPSPDLAQPKVEFERLLHERVYRHPQVLRMRGAAQEALQQMFDRLSRQPELLPDAYRQRAERIGAARSAGDYLAGMTDRFAQQLFARFVST